MKKFRYSRESNDVRIPTKTEGNAGRDIYAFFTEERIVIEPHSTVMVPTGLRFWVPKGYYMQLFERGSTGVKGIAQRAGVIDESYTGQVFVPLTNTNDKCLIIAKQKYVTEEDLEKYIVYPYEKAICQGVILPVPEFKDEEISSNEIINRKTNRGEGALGSSGK